ncbi:uncharacterized protein NEMAJ01_0020 [Nematocida major]|uniref:uncharacterized protein n=1 Tax=Nematocida major TaxID=1912982 RepID=UPI0020086B81|nr:uncharacterized protein NEMAJ01_0020 [Nematocida major]KAH9385124.1 hypothetical protein NEMAJ01_0020 [Nematocida major]
MQDRGWTIPEEERRKLSSLISAAKSLLAGAPEPDENLSLGTLDYLRKYKIDVAQ